MVLAGRTGVMNHDFVIWASTMRVLIVSCLPQGNDFFSSIPDKNLHSFHFFQYNKLSAFVIFIPLC